MQKARRHSRTSPPPQKSIGPIGLIGLISPIRFPWRKAGPVELRPLVGVWFQVHCPPLVGVLPIFRSRYWVSLSVAKEYLALRDGPRRFEPAFTCPALLRNSARDPLPTRTGLSPSTVELSRSLPLEEDLVTLMCRS